MAEPDFDYELPRKKQPAPKPEFRVWPGKNHIGDWRTLPLEEFDTKHPDIQIYWKAGTDEMLVIAHGVLLAYCKSTMRYSISPISVKHNGTELEAIVAISITHSHDTNVHLYTLSQTKVTKLNQKPLVVEKLISIMGLSPHLAVVVAGEGAEGHIFGLKIPTEPIDPAKLATYELESADFLDNRLPAKAIYQVNGGAEYFLCKMEDESYRFYNIKQGKFADVVFRMDARHKIVHTNIILKGELKDGHLIMSLKDETIVVMRLLGATQHPIITRVLSWPDKSNRVGKALFKRLRVLKGKYLTAVLEETGEFFVFPLFNGSKIPNGLKLEFAPLEVQLTQEEVHDRFVSWEQFPVIARFYEYRLNTTYQKEALGVFHHLPELSKPELPEESSDHYDWVENDPLVWIDPRLTKSESELPLQSQYEVSDSLMNPTSDPNHYTFVFSATDYKDPCKSCRPSSLQRSIQHKEVKLVEEVWVPSEHHAYSAEEQDPDPSTFDWIEAMKRNHAPVHRHIIHYNQEVVGFIVPHMGWLTVMSVIVCGVENNPTGVVLTLAVVLTKGGNDEIHIYRVSKNRVHGPIRKISHKSIGNEIFSLGDTYLITQVQNEWYALDTKSNEEFPWKTPHLVPICDQKSEFPLKVYPLRGSKEHCLCLMPSNSVARIWSVKSQSFEPHSFSLKNPKESEGHNSTQIPDILAVFLRGTIAKGHIIIWENHKISTYGISSPTDIKRDRVLKPENKDATKSGAFQDTTHHKIHNGKFICTIRGAEFYVGTVTNGSKIPHGHFFQFTDVVQETQKPAEVAKSTVKDPSKEPPKDAAKDAVKDATKGAPVAAPVKQEPAKDTVIADPTKPTDSVKVAPAQPADQKPPVKVDAAKPEPAKQQPAPVVHKFKDWIFESWVKFAKSAIYRNPEDGKTTTLHLNGVQEHFPEVLQDEQSKSGDITVDLVEADPSLAAPAAADAKPAKTGLPAPKPVKQYPPIGSEYPFSFKEHLAQLEKFPQTRFTRDPPFKHAFPGTFFQDSGWETKPHGECNAATFASPDIELRYVESEHRLLVVSYQTLLGSVIVDASVQSVVVCLSTRPGPQTEAIVAVWYIEHDHNIVDCYHISAANVVGPVRKVKQPFHPEEGNTFYASQSVIPGLIVCRFGEYQAAVDLTRFKEEPTRRPDIIPLFDPKGYHTEGNLFPVGDGHRYHLAQMSDLSFRFWHTTMRQFEYAGFPLDSDQYGYINHIFLRGSSTDGHLVCLTHTGIFVVKLGRTPKITRKVPANKPPKPKNKEKPKSKKDKRDKREFESSDTEDKVPLKPWEMEIEQPFIFKGKFLVMLCHPLKLYILPLFNNDDHLIDGKLYDLPEEFLHYKFVSWNRTRLSVEARHEQSGQMKYFESIEALRDFPDLAGPEFPRDAEELVDMIQDDPEIAIPLHLAPTNFDGEGKRIPPQHPPRGFPYVEAMDNKEDKTPDYGPNEKVPVAPSRTEQLKAKYLKALELRKSASLNRSMRGSVDLCFTKDRPTERDV